MSMLVVVPVPDQWRSQLESVQREYHVDVDYLPPVGVEVMSLEEAHMERLEDSLQPVNQFEISFTEIGCLQSTDSCSLVTFDMDEESEEKWRNFCHALGCEFEFKPFIQLGTCFNSQDLQRMQSEISQKTQVFSMSVSELVFLKQNTDSVYEEHYFFNITGNALPVPKENEPSESGSERFVPRRPASPLWGQPGFYEITASLPLSDGRMKLKKGTIVKVMKVNQKQAQISHPVKGWCPYKSSHIKPRFQLVKKSPSGEATYELASKVTVGSNTLNPRADLKVEVVCVENRFLSFDEVEVRVYLKDELHQCGKMKLFNKKKQFALSSLSEDVEVQAVKGIRSVNNGASFAAAMSDVQSVASFQSETTCTSSAGLSVKSKWFLPGKFYQVKNASFVNQVSFVPNLLRNSIETSLYLQSGTKVYVHRFFKSGSVKVTIIKPGSVKETRGFLPKGTDHWLPPVQDAELEGTTFELEKNISIKFVPEFRPNNSAQRIKLRSHSKIFVQRIRDSMNVEVVVQQPGSSPMQGYLDGSSSFGNVRQLKPMELGTDYYNNFGVECFDEPRLTGWKQGFFKKHSTLVFTDLQGHFGKVNRPGKTPVWINLLSTNLKKMRNKPSIGCAVKKFAVRSSEVAFNTENFPALGC